MSDSLGFENNEVISLPIINNEMLSNVIITDNTTDTFDKSNINNTIQDNPMSYDKLCWYGLTDDNRIRQFGFYLDADRENIGFKLNNEEINTNTYYKTTLQKSKYWKINSFSVRTFPNEGAFGFINFQSKQDETKFFTIIVGSDYLYKYYLEHLYY